MPSLIGTYRKFEEQYFNMHGLMQMMGEDGHETQEIQCFRKGTKVTGKDMWEMLSRIADSDAEGLGKLLGVSPSIVKTWKGLLDSNREKLRQADDVLANNRRPVMIQTGRQP